MRYLELKESNTPVGIEPERVKLLVEFVPKDVSHWGVLESVRGTTWEEGVKEIDSDIFSHALHGFLQPLLGVLPRPPLSSAKRVSDLEGMCGMKDGCMKYERGFCKPGSEKGKGWRKKFGPPECYQPPLTNPDPKAFEVFFRLAMAWKENRYTLVVKGEGFNLK